MTIEEIKAIEFLRKRQEFMHSEPKCVTTLEESIDTLLNLIEKLEDKNKTLERLLQGELYEMYLYYKELAGKYQANCISKDEIREKIKQVENGTYDAKNILEQLLEE